MKTIAVCTLLLLSAPAQLQAQQSARFVETPYTEQKVVFDFFFNHPEHINSALFWIRSLINPLTEAPYSLAPEQNDIKVIIHGVEIVTVVKKNYAKYKDAVDRMRYYAELGVEFRVCALASQDYGYTVQDFHDFVMVVPSAITELAHWQLQNYAVIEPKIMSKELSIEEIR